MGYNPKTPETKWKAFVELYLSNGYKAQDAYREIFGITNNYTLNSSPYRLLKRPEVKEYLEMRKQEIYDAMGIDAYRVNGELASIAFAPKGDEIYTTSAKLNALNLLSKNLGLQNQKVEQKEVIEVSIVGDKDEN